MTCSSNGAVHKRHKRRCANQLCTNEEKPAIAKKVLLQIAAPVAGKCNRSLALIEETSDSFGWRWKRR
jgi:hypothetical protein